MRKENHQKNTSVYGCSSDGEHFTLLKIDGKSLVSPVYPSSYISWLLTLEVLNMSLRMNYGAQP